MLHGSYGWRASFTAADSARLTLESLTDGQIVGQVRREHLDGDVRSSRVSRAVDLPHATRTRDPRIR